MQTVSARFLEAARTSHTVTVSAVHTDLITGKQTPLQVVDGTVTVDVTAANRRMLNLTVPPQQATWDTLSVPGGEITVTKTVRYIDGSTETVPLGVFVVDQDAIGYAPGDTITLTCPDRSIKVQRGRFGLARSSVASNAAWQEIQRLVEAVWPGTTYPFPGWAQLDETATTKVGPIVWTDGDRWKAITDLCKANSLEFFFDAQGKAVLRPVPILTTNSVPVWTVDAQNGGVLIGASRTRDLSQTHNAVIVTSSATNVVVTPQEDANTTAGDPLSTTGPLGYVPVYYSSPAIQNTAQAMAAAKTILRRELGVAQQISLEASPNDALDAEDVIKVILPQTDLATSRPVELHILDSVTIPLTAAGSQTMQTRSTRAPAADEGSLS